MKAFFKERDIPVTDDFHVRFGPTLSALCAPVMGAALDHEGLASDEWREKRTMLSLVKKDDKSLREKWSEPKSSSYSGTFYSDS